MTATLRAPKPPFVALTQPKESVLGCALSPDGARLAVFLASPRGRNVRLHEWPSLSVVAEVKVDGAEPGIFSPDSTHLAFPAGVDVDAGWHNGRRLRIADAATGKTLAETASPKQPPTSAAYSPDGSRIALGEFEGVRIVDARTGKDRSYVHDGDIRIVHDIAWSPDGKTIVARSYGDVMVLAADKGKQVATLPTTDDVETGVAFLADGSLVTMASETELAVWAAGRWKEPARKVTVKYAPRFIAVAPEAGLIVTAGRNHGVHAWTAKLEHAQELAKPGSEQATVSITPDASALVVVAERPFVWTSGETKRAATKGAPAVKGAPASKKAPAITEALAAPHVDALIASPRTVDIADVAALEAFVAKTRWLSQVGRPTKADVARLSALEKWNGAEQPRLEPVFGLPQSLLDQATLVARAMKLAGREKARSLSARVYAAAAKSLKTKADGDVTQDPYTAAVHGASITVEAAAVWLALGWKLPPDLQTLLAWYGDGRWPCGLATAPREGKKSKILIC